MGVGSIPSLPAIDFLHKYTIVRIPTFSYRRYMWLQYEIVRVILSQWRK